MNNKIEVNVGWWHWPVHLQYEYVGHHKYKTHIFSDMQGKFSAAGWWYSSQKLQAPHWKQPHELSRVTLDQLVCSSSIYGTLNSQHTWTWFRNYQKVNNVYFNVFYPVLSLDMWLEEWMVSNIKKWLPILKVKQKYFPQNIFRWRGGERGRWKQRERKSGSWRRGVGGWGWMKQQQRIQQWRQRPENNMPNPGSHFLLHRRLLWNSSSVANVTTRRRGRGRKLRPFLLYSTPAPPLFLPLSSPSSPSTVSCLLWS